MSARKIVICAKMTRMVCQYVATVLAPYYKDQWQRADIKEHKLRYNGRIVVRGIGDQPARTFETDACRGGTLIVSLLLKRHCPFTLFALTTSDGQLPPLGYNVYVKPRLFTQQMENAYTVVGEMEVSQLFRKFRILFFPGGYLGGEEEPTVRIPKRRRLESSRVERGVEWMMEAEAKGVVSVPRVVPIPDTDYMFCMRDNLFLTRSTFTSANLDVRGALLLGGRNAGKTAILAALLSSAPPPRPVPHVSALVYRAHAALCVVPEPLIAQWCAALDRAEVRYVVVVDKPSWCARMTRASLADTSVVLTSHAFLFAHVQLLAAANTRFQSRAVLQDPESTGALRMEWVHWQRIIVDELEGLYVDHVRVWPRLFDALGTDMWWGIQGGLTATHALRTLNLLDAVAPQITGASPHVHDLIKDHVLYLPPLYTRHWTSSTTCKQVALTPLERAVYTALKDAGVSSTDLTRVCAGDLSPMDRFVTIVSSWHDAIPLGERAIDECFQYIDDDDDEDYYDEGEEEEDSSSAFGSGSDSDGEAQTNERNETQVADQVVNSVADDAELFVPVANPDPDVAIQQEEAEEDTEEQQRAAAAAYEADVEAQFNEAFSSAMRDAHEKRVFFNKVARELASGTVEVQTCAVCMAAPSDCLFVCGHMLCHACSVNVFVTAARAENITITDRTNLIAPCPTCRWNTEPHEIYWMCNVSPSAIVRRGSKLDALLALCTGPDSSTVVFAEHGSVLSHMREQLTGLGVSARVMSGSVKHCQRTLRWLKSAGSRVLLVPCSSAAGLKFAHTVTRAVFLHPVSDAVESACMQCMPAGGDVAVIKLISTDTHETP